VFSGKKTRIPENDRKPRTLIWGSAPPQIQETTVPRIIWSYWNGQSSPCANACRDSWINHQSSFIVRALTPETLTDFLPDFPILPEDMPQQKVSNLIRLMLLERYGGIWIDYSTLLTQSLDWVVDLAESSNCEAVLFYNEFYDEYRVNHARPIVENGFILSQKGSKFISDWRIIYQSCIQSGDFKTFFRSHDNFEELTSNFIRKSRSYIDYFICYISAQHVMLKSDNYRILMINAEDEYYYLSYKTKTPRSTRELAQELLLRNFDPRIPPKIIKLTGGNRAGIDEHIAYNCFRKNSLLGRYLKRR
jgi:hypothetical protein